ncbi:MAG: hemolysin family protein [Vulcanimicrobiota bacterium]
MDDPQSYLIIAGGLTVLLAIITATITALTFIKNSVLEKKSEVEKNKRAGKILKLVKGKKNQLISGLSFLRLLVALCIGGVIIFYSVKTNDLTPGRVFNSSIIIYAVIIILIGEVLPRFISFLNPELIAGIFYPFLVLVSYMVLPVSDACTAIFKPVINRFHRIEENGSDVTEDEILHMVKESHKMGLLDEDQKDMIRSVFEFTDTIAREAMIPRVDIEALDINATLQDVIDKMAESGFSRIPIYQDSLDNILGIVYHKDFISQIKDGKFDTPAIEVARKPPFFIPATKPIDELLREMQYRSISIAIVVDEYGGTSGLITIEDLLEELVGEITDEYDRETPEIIQESENTWMVDGGTIIEDVNEELKINVPIDEHETIGGFVYGCLGHIPHQGEKATLENIGIDIEVEKIEGQRIQSLLIKKHPWETEEE